MLTSTGPSFWEWSLTAWARPDVESCCLRLQEERGVFIPALLFAAWCARHGHEFTRAALAPLRLAEWEEQVITRVRNARKAARQLGGEEGDAYTRLRACELALEKHLMERLAGIVEDTADDGGRTDPATRRRRLQENLATLDIRLPPADQAALAELLLEAASG